MSFRETFPEEEAYQLNALKLAYIGDTVWEMLIREQLIHGNLNVTRMHRECVSRVNATAQSETAHLLEEHMNSREMDIFHRGRNAHAHHPSPKHQNPRDYAMATGLEAVFGYLYLTGQKERIQELFQKTNGGNENG